jgi:transcriptional regulator with XRE-family HTH domain
VRTIGGAIRSVRKHLKETATAFGLRLRLDNATISRYEHDKLNPSAEVLLNLYALAKKFGLPEQEVFMYELKRFFQRGLIGGPDTMTPEEVIQSLARQAGEMSKGYALMDLLQEKNRDWGFRQFVVAVAKVMDTCQTVDESVADILQLWAAHWNNPSAPQYFRDALGFLRTNLWRQSAGDAGKGKAGRSGDE